MKKIFFSETFYALDFYKSRRQQSTLRKEDKKTRRQENKKNVKTFDPYKWVFISKNLDSASSASASVAVGRGIASILIEKHILRNVYIAHLYVHTHKSDFYFYLAA